MFTWFEARGRAGRTASKLYGSIVTQARAPAFYADLGVPDTMEGRYGLLVVHLWLVMERLSAAGDTAGLSRALVETFVTDIDDNMREIGVGDLAVPRKVKKAAAGLYDRAPEYERAFTSEDDGVLAEVLSRHVGGMPAPGALRLAAYLKSARRSLAAASIDELVAGDVTFPALSGGTP